jgi:hypothetical protein
MPGDKWTAEELKKYFPEVIEAVREISARADAKLRGE